MKVRCAVIVIVSLMVAVLLGGCSADQKHLELSDRVIYTGKLIGVTYSNNQLEGYQLRFEDGKTIFVVKWIAPSFPLYQEGFDLGESYTISQTRTGEPYVQRTDVLEQRRTVAAEE